MASCCLHLITGHPPPSGRGPVVFFLGTTSPPLSLHTAQEGVSISPARVADRSSLGSEHIPSPGPRDWFWDGHVTRVKPPGPTPKLVLGLHREVSFYLLGLVTWQNGSLGKAGDCLCHHMG